MFWLDTDKSKPEIITNETNRLTGIIEYGGKQYTRNIELYSDEIVITDNYNSKLEKYINLYLYPDINIEHVENNVYKLWNEKKMVYLDAESSELIIDKYEFSPSYGVKLQSTKIVLSSKNNKITHKFRVSIES
jgi:hypothetical protein